MRYIIDVTCSQLDRDERFVFGVVDFAVFDDGMHQREKFAVMPDGVWLNRTLFAISASSKQLNVIAILLPKNFKQSAAMPE